MALLTSVNTFASSPNLLPLAALLLGIALLTTVAFRIIHCLFFHPLKHFPGPWYAACSSLPLGAASVLGREPIWLHRIAKKYGKDGSPIRITPNLLFFHKVSALREIYSDPKCNQKSTMYGHEGIGPTSIFQVLDGGEHKQLRKALGGGEWAIGAIKRNWEGKVDGLIKGWKDNQMQVVEKGGTVVLSNKVSEFAADVMSMVLFTEPWGFIRNNRDERGMLQAWRDGLPIFGLSQRWRFFREVILPGPLGKYVAPKESDARGNGWLIHQSAVEIAERKRRMEEEGYYPSPPDFLQLTVDAKVGGDDENRELTDVEKLANVTIFIQAGADTTGSGLGATLRFLATDPERLAKVQKEIAGADQKGLLSEIVQYDETKKHLPYMCAVIRESLRLNPPIPNIFPRLSPPGGKTIDGVYIPEGAEMTSESYVVQRDPEAWGDEDVDSFVPERWLKDEESATRMDSNMFVFGMGPRICIGKDIALLELHKLLPEILRRFDIELVQEGRYKVVGGIASHQPAFKAKLHVRAV